VREFTYNGDNGDDRKMAFHTRVRIAQLWTSPLLPFLRRFICPEVQAPGLFIHFLFLSPTIEYIELKLISEIEDEAIGTFLSTLVENVPSLKNLSMSGWLSDQSLAFVPQLKRLQSLEISNISAPIGVELLQQIGALEYLSDFTIDLSASTPTRFKLQGAFSQLQRLRVNAAFSVAHDVLSDIEAPQLAAIHLIAPMGILPQGWTDQCKRALELISRRWGKLREFSLEHEGMYDHEVLPTDILSPLFQLTHLSSFEINSFLFMASDTDVRQYAAAWPRLQTLRFPPDLEIPTDASFTTLSCLARSCPDLRELQMPFNIERIPPLSTSHVLPHPLRTLSLGGFSIAPEFQQLLLIARHIDRLFPDLRILRNAGGSDPYLWDKVGVMVHTFQAVRMDDLDANHNPKV
jgi:hypothetical protein